MKKLEAASPLHEAEYPGDGLQPLGELVLAEDLLLRLVVQRHDGEHPPAPGGARGQPPVLVLEAGHVAVVGEDPALDVRLHTREPGLRHRADLLVHAFQICKNNSIRSS